MKKSSILLIEDSEDDAYFFAYSFQASGVASSLHRLNNAVEAVKFLTAAEKSKSLPAVIFLDLNMPLMKGFEFLAWLREQPYAGRIAVYVLSGSERQEDKDRAAELGAKGYMVKPVVLVDLQRLLGGPKKPTQTNA